MLGSIRKVGSLPPLTYVSSMMSNDEWETVHVSKEELFVVLACESMTQPNAEVLALFPSQTAYMILTGLKNFTAGA